MNDGPALMMMLMTVPVVVMLVVAALNARKVNARWRERREARARAHDPGQ